MGTAVEVVDLDASSGVGRSVVVRALCDFRNETVLLAGRGLQVSSECLFRWYPG